MKMRKKFLGLPGNGSHRLDAMGLAKFGSEIGQPATSAADIEDATRLVRGFTRGERLQKARDFRPARGFVIVGLGRRPGRIIYEQADVIGIRVRSGRE